ncbi:YjbH domain-containing protein [Rheinheimera baltica]|uniref:YjbH domain-containing protein n=1 Tax=Rheinheimera baltica TaxID=67576 RepID=A0ABT9I284_9GAMM|nr:YjbH domain-containing protein [Rheinheimera baltica]MDP5137499.1 YjbH domain-containing protein [Rheinheimera baltica]
MNRATQLGVMFCALFAASTLAQDSDYNQASHGGVGIFQTPTARMAPSGNFSLNYNDLDEYRFWSASIQLFPWLETTVRYTDVRNRLYSLNPEFSGDQTLKDKGIDVKLRLWQESYYLPQVSLGWRDFGGTGFFESEYIAASKRVGPFDLHLGMGWGYLGSGGNISNPFCELSDGYCQRPGGFSGRGGMIDFQEFYKGPASVFAGLEYQTPWEPLRLKVEYEGNNYTQDRARGIVQDSKINYGLVYSYDSLDFHLSYQRGNTLAFGVSVGSNFNTIKTPKFDRPPPEVNAAGLSAKRFKRTTLRNQLYYRAGFVTTGIKLDGDELIIRGQQQAFREFDVSIERVGRVLANFAPDKVSRYRIILEELEMPITEVVLQADEFRAYARYESLDQPVSSVYVRHTPDMDDIDWQFTTLNHGFGYSFEPFWMQMLGNPEAFFMYQGGILSSLSYQFSEPWSATGVIKTTLLENFDKFNFKVDTQNSTLPRVRTFSREYVTRSYVTLDKLFLNYRERLQKDVYAQAYGGYLETMFAGVGGEVLYRPLDSRFAIGADINYVRQRDYNSEYKLFDYSVVTGFVSLYWEPEFFDDSLITISAGRYLAKDVGVNIDVGRRFDSGIIVGAYAALSNASADEYGEGSFTKGFYVKIPFDLMSFKSAKGMGQIPWIPLARDGGQMLKRPVYLHGVTSEREKPRKYYK